MKKIFSILTLCGLVLGILFGIFFKDLVPYIEFIGTWYVAVLKVFIGPVIFTGIASSIYRTANNKDRLVLRSVLLFTVMFTASFLLASLITVIADPAKGFEFEGGTWIGSTIDVTLKGMILNLLPKDLSEVFISPKVFFIIVLAWVIGKIGSMIKASEPVFCFLERVRDFFSKALEIFMYTTPIAVFSLMASSVSKYGDILLGIGIRYIGTAYLCSLAVLIAVMILPVYFFTKITPFEYIKKVYRIWIMTITTCSSAAALPYTVKLCNEEFGIKKEVTDVVVPLGCTIHMCGGAVSFALLGIFCSRLYGIEIDFGAYLLMLLASLLLNMAAPGIPGGGIVIGASYLEMMGIPLGFIGFYSGIYKFLDMSYTTLNVTGDISANILLSKRREK